MLVLDQQGEWQNGGAGQCTDETLQTVRDPIPLSALVLSLSIIFDKVSLRLRKMPPPPRLQQAPKTHHTCVRVHIYMHMEVCVTCKVSRRD